MAVWSMAQSGDISIAGRIDSDFFHPEFLELDRVLHQLSTERISRQFSISDGNHISISRHFSPQGEVPYFRGQDINDFFLENSRPIRIPQKVFDSPGMKRSHFIGEDVLICIVGASTGTIGLVSESDTPATGSCKIGIIRKKNGAVVDPLYLVPFLMGKFGQYQVRRHSRGTAQGGLILIDLMKLSVPVLPWEQQQAIRALVSSSIKCNSVSRQLYTQAQQLLESELGLDNLRFDKPVGYTARFSELELSRRVDADFFNPELRYFQQEIAKHHPLHPITDFVSILKFSNPPYSDVGLPIITQKHLGKISPDNYGDDLVAYDAWVQANPLATIRNYDLLYYSVGAYLGKTNIWLSNDNAVHASFITMLRPFDPEESGFLHVLLNSNYGILQSKCFQSGTSQPYIYPKDIRRFLMPVVSKSLRRQLHELVIESYKNGDESKQLLNQAKSHVEQLIEEAVRA